jgi:hypothetical protein
LHIKFISPPHGAEVLPTQGQAFFYFGEHIDSFASVFAEIGHLTVSYRPPPAHVIAEADKRAAADPEALADVIGQVPRVHEDNDAAAEEVREAG